MSGRSENKIAHLLSKKPGGTQTLCAASVDFFSRGLARETSHYFFEIVDNARRIVRQTMLFNLCQRRTLNNVGFAPEVHTKTMNASEASRPQIVR